MANTSEEAGAGAVDLERIRRDIYLGPGYHVIRGFMAPSQAEHIRSYWETHRNAESGDAVPDVTPTSADFSKVTADLDQHFGYFWNRPIDRFTYVTAWELQALRNRVEGNDPNLDFLPHAFRNRFEREYYSYAAYRVTATRRGGAIDPHVDWPLNHARVQLSLMLSTHGEDYNEGGFLFYDDIRNGEKLNLCETENLQKGDLLIFRYFHKHGVEAVTTPEGKPGFCRLLMPLRYLRADDPGGRPTLPRRVFGKLPEPAKNLLRDARRRATPSSNEKQYKELSAGDHDKVFYYDNEVERLMQVAVENGVDPTEVYYHRGLWARWKMMADWQFDWLKRNGLRPEHQFLDIGCGPARLGINLVPYLEDDRYCGVDPLQSFIDLGHVYLKEVTQTDKTYRLACTEDFDFAQFDRKFDFAMAHSVFTHLSYELIERCLQSLKPVMNPGGQLIFTITMGADREEHFVYVKNVPMTSSMHKDMSLYEKLGQKIGFRAELIGREDHPSQFVCRATFDG